MVNTTMTLLISAMTLTIPITSLITNGAAIQQHTNNVMYIAIHPKVLIMLSPYLDDINTIAVLIMLDSDLIPKLIKLNGQIMGEILRYGNRLFTRGINLTGKDVA
jgi:hypothetical protein